MIFNGGYYIALPFILLSFSFLYSFYRARLPRTKFAKRNYFGYAIFSLFIALGAIDAQIGTKPDVFLPKVKDYAIAKINEEVEIKERSIESKASIVKLNGVEEIRENFNVVLYLQQDSLSKKLTKGDVIIFEKNLQPIIFLNNFSSFNYSSKLEREGFYYSQYIPSDNWQKIDHIKPNSLRDKASQIKYQLFHLPEQSSQDDNFC